MKIFTSERITENCLSDNPVFQRQLYAYKEAEKFIHDDVLEIGCGDGYGAKILAPYATSYTAIDKFKTENKYNLKDVNFLQMEVPHLKGLADNSFNVVISFQLIEHIQDDKTLVSEVHRVLKPGGKFICTTPNKLMSLTRNPYHVREYTKEGLYATLKKNFEFVNLLGVFPDAVMLDYYEKNKLSVRKITRFDIFNLQYILPRFLLRIPYDISNRISRNILKKSNTKMVSEIDINNFFLAEANATCFDFFCIATKSN
jgi:ubiquinone/menaquinone biosynthesis C-methylase UbiE